MESLKFQLKMLAITLRGTLNLNEGYYDSAVAKDDLVNQLRFSYTIGDLKDSLAKLQFAIDN